jgi:hypothetical protein
MHFVDAKGILTGSGGSCGIYAGNAGEIHADQFV